MERMDYYKVGILMLIPILIFFPLLNSTYFYTDEVLHLWMYRKGSTFAMFVPQGRLLHDWLCRLMYSNIDTIAQLDRLRLFGLVSWLVGVPVWYVVLWRVCRDEELPSRLPFIAVLFLVCSLPFAVGVQWGACMQLALANTCGLLSGFFVYRYDRRGWAPALLFGLISLGFYQNGFGCFLLPFFLRLIARQEVDRRDWRAALVYFFIYVIYYVVVMVALKLSYHSGVTGRAALATNPLNKAFYMLLKVLPQSFYFNVIVTHTSIGAGIFCILVLGGGLWLNYKMRIARNFWLYLALFFGALVLIYIPSLILRENYSSNRTLMGLDMAIDCWVVLTLMQSIKSENLRSYLFSAAGVIMVFMAVYNFRSVFLRPAIDEFVALKNYVDQHYRPEISSVDYIRSPEDLVRKKYGVETSWDEFGNSSSYFAWVPDALTRQLVFEKTGSRSVAEKLAVRVWVDGQAYRASGVQGGAANLLIDAPAILGR